jgi:hypothetical protein
MQVAEQRNRTLAAPTFSASGLYLARVEYDPHWDLPGGQVDADQVLRRTGLAALLPA